MKIYKKLKREKITSKKNKNGKGKRNNIILGSPIQKK